MTAEADRVTGSKAAPRTGLVRVGLGLGLGAVAWCLPLAAGSTVLLPARIAATAPDHKVVQLALLHGGGALSAMVATVVAGALSDRTFGRFGARTPWIVGGAVTAALLMVPLSHAASFGATLAWWCLVAVALAGTAAALPAILPDRVPEARRATLSAVLGVGVLVGTAAGAVLGSRFLDDTGKGLRVAGAVAAVLAVLAVLAAPDRPRSGGPGDGTADARPLRGALTAAARFPRRAPDFYWALRSRLLLVVGYFMINGFQLYVFTDYVGSSADAAGDAVASTSVVFLGTALLGSVVAGPLSDRSGRRKVFVVGAALLGVVAVAWPFASATVAAMLGFAAVGGVAFGVFYAVDAALMSEVLPDDDSRARDLGILNAATTGGQVLAPAASAGLLALGIGFGPVFAGAMLACAAAALCVRPIRSVR